MIIFSTQTHTRALFLYSVSHSSTSASVRNSGSLPPFVDSHRKAVGDHYFPISLFHSLLPKLMQSHYLACNLSVWYEKEPEKKGWGASVSHQEFLSLLFIASSNMKYIAYKLQVILFILKTNCHLKHDMNLFNHLIL